MSEYKTLVWIAVSLFLVYWLFIREATPLKHRDLTRERLSTLMQMFYFRGADKAELFIEAQADQRRLVTVRKRIERVNTVHLDLEADLAASSEAYMQFKDGLASRGLPCEEVPGSPTGTVRILVRRLDDAVGVDVVMTLASAANVSLEKDCYLYARRVSANSRARIGWERA